MSPKLIRPTDEENSAITVAALADPDGLPMTDGQLAKLKPMRGRPVGSGSKQQVTVRFDTEVIEAFRAGGNGWQTRMNDALKEWLRSH